MNRRVFNPFSDGNSGGSRLPSRSTAAALSRNSPQPPPPPAFPRKSPHSPRVVDQPRTPQSSAKTSVHDFVSRISEENTYRNSNVADDNSAPDKPSRERIGMLERMLIEEKSLNERLRESGSAQTEQLRSAIEECRRLQEMLSALGMRHTHLEEILASEKVKSAKLESEVRRMEDEVLRGRKTAEAGSELAANYRQQAEELRGAKVKLEQLEQDLWTKVELIPFLPKRAMC